MIATTGVRGLIRPEWVRKGQVILALSNPDAEIEPILALERGAAFAADGKSINNVSGFPGLFKGALEAGAPRFTDGMLMAARRARAARGSRMSCCRIRSISRRTAVTAAVRAAASSNPCRPRLTGARRPTEFAPRVARRGSHGARG